MLQPPQPQIELVMLLPLHHIQKTIYVDDITAAGIVMLVPRQPEN